MATDGGGKIRPKRQHDPGKPYERRQSLLGRVSDTVKDMLSPSWIVDLVSSVKKKTPPPSQFPNRGYENRHMQADGSVGPPPPMPRLGDSLLQTPTHPMQFPQRPISEGENTAPGTSDHIMFTTDQLPINDFKSTMPQTPVVNGGDDQSEHSEYSVSTSGCSSMVPHPDRRDYQREILQLNESKLQLLQRDLHQGMQMNNPRDKPVDTSSATEPGMKITEGSFLWSNKTVPSHSQPQPSARSQKPSFNISAFNSSLLSSDNSTMFGSMPGESPYYPGKTVFGGAAAHRRSKLPASSPYQITPAKRQVKAKPLKQSDSSGVSSSTAKRILDTLERMSTPLSDAKKIPSYGGNASDSLLEFTPTSYRRKASMQNRATARATPNAPPVKKISTPGFASLAENRQPTPRIETPLEIMKENPKPEASQRPTPYAGGSKGGKMKRERGGHHYSSKSQEDDEEVEMPDLPTNVTLNISNMPKLDFGISNFKNNGPLTTTTTMSSLSAPNGPLSVSPQQVNKNAVYSFGASPAENNKNNGNSFTFSSPIQKSAPQAPTSPNSSGFTFSSPIKIDGDSSSQPEVGVGFTSLGGGSATTMTFSSPFSTAPKPKQPAPSPAVTFDAYKPASELKQGSVMDILGEGKSPATTEGFGGIKPASQLKVGSVMDFLNKDSKNVLKPTSESEKNSVSDTLKNDTSVGLFGKSSSSISMFGKPAGGWECPTCMINNKAEVSKCPACETPKPMAKPPSSTPVPGAKMSSGSDLSNFAKKPSGSWECPTCMINNKAEVLKCVACTTAKPMDKPAAATPIPGTKMSSGPDLSSFANKPSGSWECPTCMINNKADAAKCVACETPNPTGVTTAKNSLVSAAPVSSTSPWECDTCLVQNQAKDSKCIACQAPKPGAVQPPTSFTSPGGFKFAPGGGFSVDTSQSDKKNSTQSSFSMPFASSTVAPSGGGFKIPTDVSNPISGGMKFGNVELNAIVDKPASGGFKIGGADVKSLMDKPTTGGITFGNENTNENKDNKPKTLSGGFTFGSTDKKSEKTDSKPSLPSGITFGAQTETVLKTDLSDSKPLEGISAKQTDCNNTKENSMGGFKIGSFSANQTGGFNFAKSSESKTGSNETAGGYQFGQATVPKDLKAESGNNGATEKPAAAGFGFGSKVESDGKGTSSPFVFGADNAPSFKPVFGAGAEKKDKPLGTVATSAPPNFTFGTAGKDTKAGGFPFGAGTTGADKESTPAASSFMFGQSADSSKSTGPASTFSFSANSTTNKPKVATAPGFFTNTADTSPSKTGGKRSHEDANGPGDAKKANFSFGGSGGAPSFAFGQQNTSASTSSSSNSTLFSFSANKSNTTLSGSAPAFGQTAPAPAFGTNPTTTAKPVPAFGGFGSQTSASFGSATNTSASAGTTGFGTSAPGGTTPASFQFGSTAQTGGVFQFGANSQTPAAGNAAAVGGAASGLVFGQQPNQPQQQATQQGFNFAASANPNFNFGGANPTPAAGPIQFGAPAGASNPFSVAPSSGPAPRRQIKKAVRKLRK